MATVNRSPFWVPRPPNDFPWIGKPIPRDMSAYPPLAATPFHILRLDFNSYESIPWGQPYQYNPLLLVPFAGTSTGPFWAPDDYDEVSPWLRPYQYNPLLFPPSLVVNPFVARVAWQPPTDIFWMGAPSAADPVFMLATKPQVTSRAQSYYESPSWVGVPSAADPIFMLATQPPAPARWNYSDEVSSWRQPYQYNPSLFPPTPSSNPVTSRQKLTYDDAAFWVGAPSAADPIFLLAKEAFQPARWNYNWDEAAPWTQPYQYNPLVFPPAPSSNPISAKQRHWNDEASAWLGAPVPARTPYLLAFTVSVPAMPRWNYNWDEAPAWKQTYQYNPLLFPPPPPLPVGNPFFIRQQWYDDASTWRAVPLAAQTPYLLAFTVSVPAMPRWVYVWHEAAPWLQPVQRNANVLSPPTPPPTVARQPLWYDDAAFWVAKPVISYTLSALDFKPVIPAKAAYLDDPPPWLQPVQRNTNLSPPPPSSPPFIIRQRHWHDEAPSWRGTPLPSQTLYSLSFKAFVPARSTYNDDPPPWRQPEQINVGLFPPPPPPQVLQFRWNFTWDDPAFWVRVPQAYPIVQRSVITPTQNGCVIYGRASRATFYGKACEC
jgi:hypothetical protein